MKKIISGLLVLVLFLSTVVGGLPLQQKTVYADETSDSLGELIRQLRDLKKDPFDYIDKGTFHVLQNTDMPSSFDLRCVDTDGDGIGDSNYVTPVKLQNPFGTCWGFAAIAAAETSILGNEDLLFDGDRQLYSTSLKQGDDQLPVFDLSEKHLVNFKDIPINDPSDSQNGEGYHYRSDIKTIQDKFDFGGLPIYATSLFSSGMGPIMEDADYSAYGYPADLFRYQGLNAVRNISKVDGKWIDFCYSEDDDWSIPETLRFTQDYVLKESYMLPSPAHTIEEEGKDDRYEYNPAGTEAIKKQLLSKRAVEIGFHADNSKPDGEKEGIYISRNWAHYTDNLKDGANHAVTIVGWDDDYPATNFVAGKQPKDKSGNLLNGAWLVKNSWGSGEESFPNHGDGSWGIPVQKTDENGAPVFDEEGNPVMVGSGYFWLSYYDQSISKVEALAFDEANNENGYYLDQYDYMPVSEVSTATDDKELGMANVFKAEVNEELKQISCQTATPGTKVKYEVYLLSDNFDNPKDGICVASGETEAFEFGGFHKIALEEDHPVIVQKGQYYSVVIAQSVWDSGTGKVKYSINVPSNDGEELSKRNGDSLWAVGVINPKESYLLCNGEWQDYGNGAFQQKLKGDEYSLLAFDNFPIKAYGTKREDVVNLYCTSGSNITLKAGGKGRKETIRLRFKGKEADLPANTEIQWAVVEGSENLFDMEPDKNDSSECTLTAKASGTGYVTASCEGVGSLVLSVTVSKDGKYSTSDVEMEFGKTSTLEVHDSDGNPVDPAILILTSADEKIATVSEKGVITGTGVGTTQILITDETGAEAISKVTVVKAPSSVELTDRQAAYTGGPITIGDAKVTGSKERVTYTYYTDKDCRNKTTKAQNGASYDGNAPKNVGTYYVKATAQADEHYKEATSKAVTLNIIQASNNITKVTPASRTLKYSAVKKKAQNFQLKATDKFGAEITFKRDPKTASKTKKYISVSKTGKVKVKKGTPKGKYKVKVKVSAKGTQNYKAAKTETKSLKISVK